jgi:hypothetical protein
MQFILDLRIVFFYMKSLCYSPPRLIISVPSLGKALPELGRFPVFIDPGIQQLKKNEVYCMAVHDNREKNFVEIL